MSYSVLLIVGVKYTPEEFLKLLLQQNKENPSGSVAELEHQEYLNSLNDELTKHGYIADTSREDFKEFMRNLGGTLRDTDPVIIFTTIPHDQDEDESMVIGVLFQIIESGDTTEESTRDIEKYISTLEYSRSKMTGFMRENKIPFQPSTLYQVQGTCACYECEYDKRI